ncbi:MAG: phosphotransferase family protein, partial [Acidothermaceae bacterium]
TNADVSVLARAANNLGVLADIGIPVPRVVAYDDSCDHVAFSVLVMTKLRGRDLGFELPAMSRPQMTRLAEQITEMQRKVATLPSGTGCGFVGIGDAATRTWADVVRHPTFKPPVENWPDDCADLVPRVNALIDLVEPHLAAVTPVCFLDDVTTKNVLVEDFALTGVVDFDVVCHGDPLFQIALTGASIAAGFPAKCAFYVRELTRLAQPTRQQKALLALYEAVFLTQFLLSGSTEEDSQWCAATASVANNRLDDVEQFFAC